MITLKSYLRDEWVEGKGNGSTLVNPTTEEPVARASTDGLDFRAALDHARNVGGPALRAMTFAERGALLEAISKAIHSSRDELIEASILNAGTTRSDAKFDVDGASGTLAFYAGLGKKLGGARFTVEGPGEALTRGARFWGRHVRVPRRGVAVHVNAFNFPAWGLAEKAAVAILAGVPVVAKPATATALTSFRMMEKIVAAGVLPRGVLQLVSGSPGNLLAHLGAQDVLAFTGGGSTGHQLRALESVIQKSVRVNVEADSLNAAVLGPDASEGSDTYGMFIRDTAREITQKTGQKCTATRRIFVPRALIDAVQRDLAERLLDTKIGNPANDEVRMGPLATAQQLRDAREGIALLEKAGARIIAGNPVPGALIDVPQGKGYFMAPVLLRTDNPSDATAVHEHEVFAPVATLMPYDSIEEACTLVARGAGGLVGSLYADDRDVVERFILDCAPFHGRLLLGSAKIADQATAPGLVLPSCVHGGPGRAGGGEELGGERGLDFYTQRTALQGDRAVLDKLLGGEPRPA